MARRQCPLCRRRRGRRACPALGEQICSACCGTKRLTQIACPADCAYLQSATDHPPAIVQRQRERDAQFLLAMVHDLSGPQQWMVSRLFAYLGGDRPDTLGLTDRDLEQAAQALARTWETASRGIVYEHTATTAQAQRLANEMKQLIEAGAREGPRLADRDLADLLRRIEIGAREARNVLGGDGPDTACLAMLKRVWSAASPADGGAHGPAASEAGPGSGLIVPGR